MQILHRAGILSEIKHIKKRMGDDEIIIDEEYITTELGKIFKEEVAPYLIDLGISKKLKRNEMCSKKMGIFIILLLV